MKHFFILLVCTTTLLMMGCKTQQATMSVADNRTKPVQMILDSDFGSSTDDLFAIMMLHQYIEQGAVELKGVIVDREGEKNAQLVDVFNTYYGHPDIPIGLERNGVKNARCFIPYNGIVDLKDAEGRPLFKRTYPDHGFPDGYKLYRQLLSRAEDKSIVIVAIGFVTTLYQLFQSGGDEYSPLSGLELFEQKVKAVYIQAGRFESGDNLSGYNMRIASRQSAFFYDKLPSSVELIMSPSNIGDAMDYSPRDVLVDLSATEVNPIKAVYTHYTCDTGQRMWDTNCLVHAVEGDAAYYMSPRGWVRFVDQGNESKMLFTPDPKGNARYQLPGDSYFADSKLFGIRSFVRRVPNPAAHTIEAPQPQLTGHEAAQWARERMGQLVDKYVGSAGNDLDPNEVRMLFRPLGFTGPNQADYDEATELVVEAVYDRMLQKAIRHGKRDMVIVTGPPACGKTSVVGGLKLRTAGLLYDADLSEGDRLAQVVRKAKAAGMEHITLVPVYNDPLTCYRNSIGRGGETWRYTPLQHLVQSFRASRGKLQQLRDQHPDITFRPVDCRQNQGAVQVSVDEALTWDYTVDDKTLNDLYVYLLGLLDSDAIEPNSVEAAIGDLLQVHTSDAANQALARRIDERKHAILEAYRMR